VGRDFRQGGAGLTRRHEILCLRNNHGNSPPGTTQRATHRERRAAERGVIGGRPFFDYFKHGRANPDLSAPLSVNTLACAR
jgi:hypothetical protein